MSVPSAATAAEAVLALMAASMAHRVNEATLTRLRSWWREEYDLEIYDDFDMFNLLGWGVNGRRASLK